jgi:hypothetical protein
MYPTLQTDPAKAAWIKATAADLAAFGDEHRTELDIANRANRFPGFTELSVPNPDAFHALRYKFVNLDNVQLQLCQPPELDCPQRRYLDSHGEGVFHIGFESDIDTAAEQGAALGLDVIMRGQRPTGSGFIYFDTLDQAGVVLMARQTAG